MAQYIYGKNVVKQWILNHNKINRLYLSKEKTDQEIRLMAEKENLSIVLLSNKEFERFEGLHQHVVAEIDDFKIYTLKEVTDGLSDSALLIILDGLEDPHNLGAILRTADATEVDGIIIPKHGSVHLTPTVAKVSTGAIATVKTIEVINLTQTVETLKKQGFWIFGAEFSPKAIDYRRADFKGKICLVIGSEGKGISPLLLKHVDVIVKLPMFGQVTSLNASVSTAVLLYEVLNQRHPLK
jgi:23S rRNA (guanosine2251-2'-O)-methyltransferase